MATALRPAPVSLLDLQADEPEGSVPAPFPIFEVRRSVDQMPRDRRLQEPAQSATAPELASEPPASALELEALRDITNVQETAIIALGSLFEPYYSQWRRASRGDAPAAASSSSTLPSFDSALELQNILTNIDGRGGNPEMQARRTVSQLLPDISQLVASRRTSTLLPNHTRHLIDTILTVLTHTTTLLDRPHLPEPDGSRQGNDSPQALGLSLRRVFETSALEVLQQLDANNTNPLLSVQRSLASTYLADSGLALIDELAAWQSYSQSRAQDSSAAESVRHRHSIDAELPPPEYEHHPPAYVFDNEDEYLSGGKVRHVQSAPDLGRLLQEQSSTSASASAEKRQLDLNEVAQAIERFYSASPQIRSQRVELNPMKRQELELARIMGSVQRLGNRLDGQRAQGRTISNPSEHGVMRGTVDKGKGRAQDTEDLEDFLEMLGNSQRPRLAGQRASVSEDVLSRLRRIELTKAREAANRDLFVDRIKRSVETGRLQSQDATFSKVLTQDKSTMLTLPEFIKETRSTPRTASTLSDRHSIIGSDNTSPPLSRQVSNTSHTSIASSKVLKSKRSLFFTRPRSNSAPPSKILNNAKVAQRPPQEPTPVLQRLQYVAEHQENLRLVSVQVSLPANFPPSTQWSATFSKSQDASTATSLDLRLDAKLAPYNIQLPVAVTTTGSSALVSRLVGDHLQLKMTSAISLPTVVDDKPLLDAAHLNDLHPSSFVCSSCSLPLIQCAASEGAQSHAFSDLPSEYWTELVEAWMCHTEQKLSGDVMKQGKGGSNPSPGQFLVGGSYLLADEASVREDHTRLLPSKKHQNDWRQLRCICGAALGARRVQGNALDSTFRFAKYAIRPVGSSISYDRPPLSAYIIADMLEVVQAHASYRFVIRDEEDENVRMLIWLFNPSVRIAHSVSPAFALPKTGVSHSAKVMFKLIGPTENLPVEQITTSYPDFGEAEHLFYPLSVCHSLAVLLRNSNIAYPESSRTMGPLSLGWLRRA